MLDDIFAALSDPTRRAVVHRLGSGEVSVSALAADTSMSLPSFLKHVRVLEDSGLVRTSKTGRVRMCALRRDRFALIEDWLLAQRRIWEERTDRLEELVIDLGKENS
ncbi:helix-turn-helix transcriptional regulator [Microbacterium sp. W4I4]|uniref:ArsR/SmtB family transcription factor n=1 Tax=Microbacterium sp. W4I4 TaxID=3042295 RepID=UPI0027D7C7F2|nr:metalloregulator ArsR/SmtB family transcription factor [Microbacterium sp. W4I4]